MLVALLTTGCVTTLGYVPSNVKPTRWWTFEGSKPASAFDPGTLTPRYAEVKQWAYDVQDGYDSRSTMNRQAIYFGALFAAASAAAVVGLAAFSAGSAAIIALPIGAAFLAGTGAIYNNNIQADLYGRASTYVKRLIDISDKRLLRDPGATAHEANCLKTQVDILMARVDRHITLLDPQNVVAELNAVGQKRPAAVTSPAPAAKPATSSGESGAQGSAQDEASAQAQLNKILQYARGDLTDLDVPADLEAQVAADCDGAKDERGREIRGIRWFGALNVRFNAPKRTFLIDSPTDITNTDDRQYFQFFEDDLAREPLESATVEELRQKQLAFDQAAVLFSIPLPRLAETGVGSVSYRRPQQPLQGGVEWIGPFSVRFDRAAAPPRYVVIADGGAFRPSDRVYFQFFTLANPSQPLPRDEAQNLRKQFVFETNATFSVALTDLIKDRVGLVRYEKEKAP